MSNNQQITQTQLKENFHYDKNTGIFTWKILKALRIKIGDTAGSKTKSGYIETSLNINGARLRFYMHRLAWLYEYGEFPENQLDHINHDRSDNRISNLREANDQINQMNSSKSKNNKSGTNGVHWNKEKNKWEANISVKNKRMHLGYCKDKNEAICARLHTNRLYKFHANHGK